MLFRIVFARDSMAIAPIANTGAAVRQPHRRLWVLDRGWRRRLQAQQSSFERRAIDRRVCLLVQSATCNDSSLGKAYTSSSVTVTY
jgi:uncharacterized membrane protein